MGYTGYASKRNMRKKESEGKKTVNQKSRDEMIKRKIRIKIVTIVGYNFVISSCNQTQRRTYIYE